MSSWFEKALASVAAGQGNGRPLAVLQDAGAYILFRQAGGVFQREDSSGVPPGFQYGFLESAPELWTPVLEQGSLRLPAGQGLRSDLDLWVAVDRPGQPGFLLVVELPGSSPGTGDLLRLLLALEAGRRRSGASDAPDELPVWLRDMPGKLRRAESPVLLASEPGSGMEELVRRFLREEYGSDQDGIFFQPGRLSEAVQLREIFGDAAGARLGGAGGGTALLDRPGRVVFIQDAGRLAHQVQLRLYALLAGEEDERFWIFGASQDLEAMAEAGQFLSGLARLLASNRLVLPPVRACREFLEEEVDRLLGMISARLGRTVALGPEALEALLDYDWPGNWWELRGVLEAAVLLCVEGQIRPADLRLGEQAEERPDNLNLRKRSEELEKSLLLQAHALHGGNQVQMARALGISRGSLQYKLEKYNLSRKEDR